MPTSAERVPSKAIKIVLFWTNWLLVLFLSKRFIGSPGDNVDFLLKNLATFVIAIIGTAVVLRYLHGVILIVTIAAIWIVTILIAVVLRNFFSFSLAKDDEDIVLLISTKDCIRPGLLCPFLPLNPCCLFDSIQCAVQPPSMRSTWPVTILEASEAR